MKQEVKSNEEQIAILARLMGSKGKSVYTMPFGRHEGEDITEIPIAYLKWLFNRDIADEMVEAISKEIKRRVR